MTIMCDTQLPASTFSADAQRGVPKHLQSTQLFRRGVQLRARQLHDWQLHDWQQQTRQCQHPTELNGVCHA
jgi:hypothetical protein